MSGWRLPRARRPSSGGLAPSQGWWLNEVPHPLIRWPAMGTSQKSRKPVSNRRLKPGLGTLKPIVSPSTMRTALAGPSSLPSDW